MTTRPNRNPSNPAGTKKGKEGKENKIHTVAGRGYEKRVPPPFSQSSLGLCWELAGEPLPPLRAYEAGWRLLLSAEAVPTLFSALQWGRLVSVHEGSLGVRPAHQQVPGSK